MAGPQTFDEPALTETVGHYRASLAVRDTQLAALEADLAGWFERPPFADTVGRLAAYRGIPVRRSHTSSAR